MKFVCPLMSLHPPFAMKSSLGDVTQKNTCIFLRLKKYETNLLTPKNTERVTFQPPKCVDPPQHILVMSTPWAQKAGFQHFLVMENLNWSWKSHEILLHNFSVNPTGWITCKYPLSIAGISYQKT